MTYIGAAFLISRPSAGRCTLFPCRCPCRRGIVHIYILGVMVRSGGSIHLRDGTSLPMGTRRTGMVWAILLSQPKESIGYDELLPRELLEVEAVEELERWKEQEMGL